MKSVFQTALIGLLTATSLAAAEAPRPWVGPGFLPVTAERIAELPAAEQAPWLAYLAESTRFRTVDDAAVAAELTQVGQPALVPPHDTHSGSLPQKKEAAWFATPEARMIANNLLTYQTPAGGWNKSIPVSSPRAPGEDFGKEKLYRGTFDNNATIVPLEFIARVAHATGEDGAAYRDAFARGLRYVFAAQFPNGGWPQVYPLAGGYHDNITYNDNAITNILGLLQDIASGGDPYSFVSTADRAEAARRLERGIACLLASQVRVNGELTAWGQQYDALTLQPAAARNYEPASLSSGETTGLVMFLMSRPRPTPAIMAAIEGATTWIERTQITDHAWGDPDGRGRRFYSAPGGASALGPAL